MRSRDQRGEDQSTLSEIGSRPIRLLVVDKTAVLEHVRRRWDRLAGNHDIELTLLTPAWWIENYRRFDYRDNPDYHFQSVIGRGALAGQELRGFYRSGLREAFDRANPDVVLMMEESFSVFGLQISRARRRWAPEAPLLFYNNNVVSYDLPGFRLSRLYRWIGRVVTPQASLGLCVNRTAQEVLASTGFGTPGIELFYGVDDELFRPDDSGSDRRELVRRLGINPDATVVLCLGRQLRDKGYQDVVQACGALSKENPELPIHLIIVGSGPYSDTIASLASELLPEGTFTLESTIPFERVPALMRSADVHILPSYPEINEQFGRVNVEAMLSGTLAVATRAGGVPEVIADGGILYEPKDVATLKGILRTVAVAPERFDSVRETGRRRAVEHYSVSRFVKGVREIVRRLDRGEPADSIAESFPGTPA